MKESKFSYCQGEAFEVKLPSFKDKGEGSREDTRMNFLFRDLVLPLLLTLYLQFSELITPSQEREKLRIVTSPDGSSSSFGNQGR